MAIESRRSIVHPAEMKTSTATKQANINRRRSIFSKLVKRSSSRLEPTFVPVRSDVPLYTLFSPTRQTFSMDENAFRQPIKSNGNGNCNGNCNNNNSSNTSGGNDDGDLEFDDSKFNPPAFLREHLEKERAAHAAAQRRRHSVCASSQRSQHQIILEKAKKMRAFDDLIQSGKTKTIKLSLTPQLAA